MKNLLSLLLFLLPVFFQAQDTVFFKNSERLAVLLLEVNPDNIKYKRFDNQSGATYTVLKDQIDKIKLVNGKTEIFSSNISNRNNNIADTSKKVFLKDTTALASPPAKVSPVDTIFFLNGKKIPGKVYELTDTEIKYKTQINPDGPVYKVFKSDVSQVIFSTGMKQKFAVSSPKINSSLPSSPSSSNAKSYLIKGQTDAKMYYKHKGGAIGTGIAAFLFPIVGLIPAIACSSVPPKQHNLGYPDDRLWENRDYRYGYQKEAYRMKRKRVWTGFGLGALAGVLLYIVASN